LRWIHAGFVERWTDRGGAPEELDPGILQFRVIGVRLTDKGKARAEELELTYGPNRVWPAKT
jgi:hypothetical protein